MLSKVSKVCFSNVPDDASLEEVAQLFLQCGNVVEFQPLFKTTGRFKGMGWVSFVSGEEAQLAVELLMRADVGGQPMQVQLDTGSSATASSAGKGMAAGRSKSYPAFFDKAPLQSRASVKSEFLEGTGDSGCRVFFSNVPFSTTEETLLEVFSAAGTVTSLRIFQNETGSRGMGHVEFATPQEAAAAISLRDMDVDGRPIWVSAHASKHGPTSHSASAPFHAEGLPGAQKRNPQTKGEPTQVFFSSVPYDTSKDTLLRIFAEAGEVLNLELFEKNGKSRGMGKVTFADPASVRFAVQNLRERDVDGRPMWVATHGDSGRSASQRAPPTLGTNRAFFSNVPFDVEEQQLLSLFEEAGRVTELRLFRAPDGKSKGMGVCVYEAPAMAAAAVFSLRDRDVAGRPIWVAEDMVGHQAPGAAMMQGHVFPTMSTFAPVRRGGAKSRPQPYMQAAPRF